MSVDVLWLIGNIVNIVKQENIFYNKEYNKKF